MDPFFGNRSWYQQPDPRYSFSHAPSYRGVPVHRVDPWETRLPVHPAQRPPERSPAQRVVRIPVQFVGSKKVDRSASASKIQKAFRGFLVRKSLKKIKDIKVQVDAIEERLSKSDVVELIRKDEKERLRMNETLMSLLIKLDSICGLDFGVRQCRKAVIRKAIALQEKIDAIVASDLEEDGETVDPDIDIPVPTDVNNSNQSDNAGAHNDLPETAGALKNSAQHTEIPESIGCAEKDKVMEAQGENDGESEIVDVAVDREVKVCEANRVGDGDVLGQNPYPIENNDSNDIDESNEKQGSGADDINKNRELLVRMIEENERMMNMMTQLFEKNEAQTRLLNALTHRVETLEKAFACEKQRKKKKKNAPPRRED